MCLKLQFEISPVGWTHHLGPILLTRDFLTLFKFGRWSAESGDVCAVTFLCCFYFLSLKKKKNYLLISGCPGSLLFLHGLSLVAVSRDYSLLWYSGFSLQ